MNNLIKEIENADIPKLLKNYLMRNKHTHLYLSESLLNEIEEIYIEFDSMYIFDEAEFCSYIITGIKKQEKHDYFYHYLKKIFETSLTTISKSDISDYEKAAKLQSNISVLHESKIPRILIDMINNLNQFKSTESPEFLLKAYELMGILQTFFILYPENEYKSDFENICNSLINIDI